MSVARKFSFRFVSFASFSQPNRGNFTRTLSYCLSANNSVAEFTFRFGYHESENEITIFPATADVSGTVNAQGGPICHSINDDDDDNIFLFASRVRFYCCVVRHGTIKSIIWPNDSVKLERQRWRALMNLWHLLLRQCIFGHVQNTKTSATGVRSFLCHGFAMLFFTSNRTNVRFEVLQKLAVICLRCDFVGRHGSLRTVCPRGKSQNARLKIWFRNFFSLVCFWKWVMDAVRIACDTP